MTLLHWADSWHDREHAARLSSRPDPLLKYPLFDASHALPEIVTALSLAAVVAALVNGFATRVVDLGLPGFLPLPLPGFLPLPLPGRWSLLRVVREAEVVSLGGIWTLWH